MNLKIYLPVVLVLLVSGMAVYSSIDKRQRSLRSDYEQKIAVLSGQIAELEDRLGTVGGKLETVTSDQQKTEIALKELQNRKEIIQKSQDELLTAAVARVSPAVVSLVASKDVPKLEVVYENPFGNDPFFKDFGIRIPVYRQKGVERKQTGAGTGFVISTDGYLLTNKHVVADESASYTALLSDGTQKEARVVYRDPNFDLAVVKIEGGKFAAAQLGDSNSIKLGQTVAAIGNALGEYSNSVSVGIISGVNRDITASGVSLKNVIQTDAAINPGNSGGPLLDLSGRVVGVNVATAIGASNISFSIPINIAKEIIKRINLIPSPAGGR